VLPFSFSALFALQVSDEIVVGYESDHVNYGSLPRQCVSPWYNYASDSEGRRFNSLGRYVAVGLCKFQLFSVSSYVVIVNDDLMITDNTRLLEEQKR